MHTGHIKGGFYIKARCIQEASISTQPPHVREIWDWLIKEANHSDIGEIKRGTCLKSYKDIQEGLKWYIGWRKMQYTKWQCENAMKWLTKEVMITTMKTTRGLIISLVNYEKYQDGNNYESHKRATREPQTTETHNNKNEKNEKNKRMNTTITAPDKPDAEVGKKPVNWENCKTPQQRLAAHYLKRFCPDIYNGNQLQINSWFKRHGKALTDICHQCGNDFDIIKKAFDLTVDFFNKNNCNWVPDTVAKHICDFLGPAKKEIEKNAITETEF